MSVVLQHSLQNYGTGDEIAGALTQYGGSIIKSYFDEMVAAKHVWKLPITGGSTFQFPGSAMATASDVDPGVDRTGANQPEMEFRTVALDLKEMESDRWESLTDDFIRHFDITAAYGEAHGKALAYLEEDRLLRMISIGARQASRPASGSPVADTFPAGTIVYSDTTTSTTVLTTNYPASLTGSLSLQNDLAKLAQAFDEKNCGKDGRVAFLSPAMHRVLRQDKTLVSRDYQGTNDMLTRSLLFVEGFAIEQTNRMPAGTETSTANLALPSQYRVNNAADATGGTSGGLHASVTNYTTAVLAIAGKDAVGEITALGGVRPVNPEWVTWKNAWFMGAKLWLGAKWIRPCACGEIALSG